MVASVVPVSVVVALAAVAFTVAVELAQAPANYVAVAATVKAGAVIISVDIYFMLLLMRI